MELFKIYIYLFLHWSEGFIHFLPYFRKQEPFSLNIFKEKQSKTTLSSLQRQQNIRKTKNIKRPKISKKIHAYDMILPGLMLGSLSSRRFIICTLNTLPRDYIQNIDSFFPDY